MKNFKRISSLIVALVMIVAAMSAMFVTASAADVKAGDEFAFDLALAAPGEEGTVLTSTYWKTAAIEKSTGKILPTTQKTEQTWAAGWYGLWAANAEGGRLNSSYLFSNSEFSDCYMDLRQRDDYCGAVIFTAPVDGTYSVDFTFKINSASTCRAYVYGQTTDLASDTKNNKNDIIDLVATGVELKKGDMIVFLVEDETNDCRSCIVKDAASVTLDEIYEPGKYSFNLALAAPGEEGTVLATECWKTAAIEKSTGKLLPTTQKTEQTWAAGWYGLWAANEEGGRLNSSYLFSNSEFSDCYMDLRQRDDYCGAVIFTAPVDGKYSVDFTFKINSASTCRAYVYGQTTDLASDTKSNKNELITLTATDVELNKGDMIVFLVEDETNECRSCIVKHAASVTLTEAKAPAGGNDEPTGGNDEPTGGNTGSNPETGDALIASIVVALVAGTAIVVSKKRR